MCQMTAMIKAHTHDRVSRLTYCVLNSHISLSTRMWLDIGILGTEELLRTVSGKILDDIDLLASAIIPVPRIALSILICENASHRTHNSRAHPVLRCDQLNMAGLPVIFLTDSLCNFRVFIPDVVNSVHNLPPCKRVSFFF